MYFSVQINHMDFTINIPKCYIITYTVWVLVRYATVMSTPPSRFGEKLLEIRVRHKVMHSYTTVLLV